MQVGMMGDLYGLATSVTVFLGEEGDGSGHAIDFTEETYQKTIHVRVSDFGKLNLPPPGDFCWTALRCLLERPWFYRK
jgi:hypothetical protein